MDDEDAQARSGNTHPDVAEAEHGGRNPTGARGGAEAATATRGRTKAEVATQLMEQVVERGNMWRAYERVLRNKGAPGADGMRVTDLKAWLQAHWPAVKAALLAGSYLPREVRAVDIPKPTGGVRTLGVPTVVDRLIQQAVLQVLQPIFEGGFSESSYGFRPGRNAWQAVQAARDHVRNGRVWVADLDLAKFFDRVNHDLLMARATGERLAGCRTRCRGGDGGQGRIGQQPVLQTAGNAWSHGSTARPIARPARRPSGPRVPALRASWKPQRHCTRACARRSHPQGMVTTTGWWPA